VSFDELFEPLEHYIYTHPQLSVILLPTNKMPGVVMDIGKFRLDMDRVLGTGSSAKVVVAKDRTNGLECAAKIVDKRRLKTNSRSNLCREIQALQTLKHHNIISMLHVEEDPTHVYIFLEMCKGGDLVSVVSSRGTLTEQQAKKLFVQLIDAVKFCHAMGYTHRDIKLENCLMTDPNPDVGVCKLADFGFCIDVSDGKPLTSYCGSPSFVAPEIIKKIPYDGKACDVWGLGVILYAMLYGVLPFGDDADIPRLFRSIVHTPVQYPPSKNPVSDEVKDLITMMLNKDGQKRPTVAQIQQHAWLTGKPAVSITPIIGATRVPQNKLVPTPFTFQQPYCQPHTPHHQWQSYFPTSQACKSGSAVH
jgi:serine/threonine protein kinase